MLGRFSPIPPAVPLAFTLLDKCETSLQTHIILAQLAILRKLQHREVTA